jgi:hypothetical protein
MREGTKKKTILVMMISFFLILAGLSIFQGLPENDEEEQKLPYFPELKLVTEDPKELEQVSIEVLNAPDGSMNVWYVDGNIFQGNVSRLNYTFERPGTYEIVVWTYIEDKPVISNFSVRIRKLQPPTAFFKVEHNTGVIYDGDLLQFSALGAHDPDGEIVRYSWDIDGEIEEGELIDHVFNSSGYHYITLVVEDDDGLTDETFQKVKVLLLEDRINDNISFEVQPDREWYYPDDDIMIELNITNNFDRPLEINPFNSHNTFVEILYPLNGYFSTGPKYSKTGSRLNDMLEDRTWEQPNETISIGPGETLSFDLNLSDIKIYLGKLRADDPWTGLNEFLQSYYSSWWIDISLNISFNYIYGTNLSRTLNSGRTYIPIEWKPIHNFIENRIIENEIQEKLLTFVEGFNYTEYNGGEHWFEDPFGKIPLYVNTSMINYYSDLFGIRHNDPYDKYHMTYNYSASVSELQNFSFDEESGKWKIEVEGCTVYSLNQYYKPRSYRKTWEYINWTYMNSALDGNGTCFLVQMYLQFDMIHGPLGASFINVRQSVILTPDLEVLFIHCNPSLGIS